MIEDDEYIKLNRYTLRVIRKYIVKKTKKQIACCCGIDTHTYSRIESLKNVRSENLLKVYSYFYEQLMLLGWKQPKIERKDGVLCIILTH